MMMLHQDQLAWDLKSLRDHYVRDRDQRVLVPQGWIVVTSTSALWKRNMITQENLSGSAVWASLSV